MPLPPPLAREYACLVSDSLTLPRLDAAALRGAAVSWRDDLAALEAEIGRLQLVHERLCAKLDHAMSLVALLEEDVGSNSPSPLVMPAAPTTHVPQQADGLKGGDHPHLEADGDDTWIGAVRAWIYDAPLGLTFAEMREKIEESQEMSVRFQQSGKGYYNALSRLRSRGEIARLQWATLLSRGATGVW